MPHVCEHAECRMDEEFYVTWSSNNRTNSGNTIDLLGADCVWGAAAAAAAVVITIEVAWIDRSLSNLKVY